MADLDEIKRAGLEVSPAGAGEQILNLISQVPPELEKKKENEKRDTMDQVKLYTDLRQAGYSPGDAHKRVTRAYRSTGFIEKLINGGKDAAFEPPTETDKIALETEKSKLDLTKTKADIGKTKAETRKNIAAAKNYETGGNKRGKDSWTPNQWQSYIDFLTNEDRNPDYGTPDNDDELKYARTRLRDSAGFTPQAPGAGNTPGAAGAKIVMTGPDGKKYRIPQANVEKAKARGFK